MPPSHINTKGKSRAITLEVFILRSATISKTKRPNLKIHFIDAYFFSPTPTFHTTNFFTILSHTQLLAGFQQQQQHQQQRKKTATHPIFMFLYFFFSHNLEEEEKYCVRICGRYSDSSMNPSFSSTGHFSNVFFPPLKTF